MIEYSLIVDFSNLAYIAFSGCEELADPIPNACQRLASKIHSVERSLKELDIKVSEIIFVEDRPPLKKYERFPNYKLHRQGVSTLPKQEIKEALWMEDNWAFCHSPEFEADDTMQSLCSQKDRSIILSSDRDMWQCIDMPRVMVYDPRLRQLIEGSNIEKAFRVSKPCHIPLVKALWGDAGDEVPNVLPRAHKYFLPIVLHSDGTYEDFVRLVDENWHTLDIKRRTMYLDAEEQIFINYQLVFLENTCPIIWG